MSKYGNASRTAPLEDRREYRRNLMREWRKNNRERSRANNRRSHAKARAEGRHIPGIDPDAVLMLVGDPCSYCGGPGGEIDHIFPLADGGSGDWENLTAACRSCNARKSNRSLLDFLSQRNGCWLYTQEVVA